MKYTSFVFAIFPFPYVDCRLFRRMVPTRKHSQLRAVRILFIYLVMVMIVKGMVPPLLLSTL